MRDTFINELTSLTKGNPKSLFLITADLGFGVLDNFKDTFPENYLNVGVAEQNMTAVAAGLALEGHTVFTYSIGNFPTLRCLEQIRNDVCYHNLNVKIVSVGGGFSYGVLGMSHHATEDLSIMRSLPNIKVFSPSDLWEVCNITREISKMQGPAYLRLDKSYAKLEDNEIYDQNFEVGKARIIRQGNDITLISCGGIMEEVLAAASMLDKRGIKSRVLSFHTIKPLDIKAIKDAAEETGGIIIVEENNVLGGLGGAVSEVCFEHDIIPSFCKNMGIQDLYSEIVGDQVYLRKYHKIDRDSIFEKAVNLLGLN